MNERNPDQTARNLISIAAMTLHAFADGLSVRALLREIAPAIDEFLSNRAAGISPELARHLAKARASAAFAGGHQNEETSRMIARADADFHDRYLALDAVLRR